MLRIAVTKSALKKEVGSSQFKQCLDAWYYVKKVRMLTLKLKLVPFWLSVPVFVRATYCIGINDSEK